jgi:hypothetical protein
VRSTVVQYVGDGEWDRGMVTQTAFREKVTSGVLPYVETYSSTCEQCIFSTGIIHAIQVPWSP